MLKGLFGLIETLFDVTLSPDTAPIWHESVRFFRIERRGELIGQFYLDPMPASRQAPWRLDGRRTRSLEAPDNQQTQTPVAHLVQLRQGRGRQARPAHPRRRHHPSTNLDTARTC